MHLTPIFTVANFAATNCKNPVSTHHEPFNSHFKRSTLPSLPPSPSSGRCVSSFTAIWGEIDVGRERGKGFDKLILIPAGAACVTLGFLVTCYAIFRQLSVIKYDIFYEMSSKKSECGQSFPTIEARKMEGGECVVLQTFPFHFTLWTLLCVWRGLWKFKVVSCPFIK